MSHRIERYTIDFRPVPQQSEATTDAHLDALCAKLGVHHAHLARAKGGRKYMEVNGHFTVVGTDPASMPMVKEVIAQLGFVVQPHIQVETKAGRKENHSPYSFTAVFIGGLTPPGVTESPADSGHVSSIHLVRQLLGA